MLRAAKGRCKYTRSGCVGAKTVSVPVEPELALLEYSSHKI